MKKALSSFILLLFFFAQSHSQNLVTFSKQEVTKYMSDYTPEWGRTNDGTDYVKYQKTQDIYSIYYFNGENDLCYKYIAIYPYKSLNAVIETLNNNYVVSTEYKNSWIDYNKTIDYIWSLSRENGFVAVSCGIYEVH